LCVILIAFFLIGATYQTIATARDRRAFPATGRLVNVDGHRLHLYCTGPTNTDNPTVVLEAGLGATTAAWGWVQPAIAQTTQVCAYDRAGMGWSDPSPGPHDAHQIAATLHTLLGNAEIASPYVLVGWSYGGLYMRAFANQYRSEVAGMVLIDSSHPDQCTSTPEGKEQCKRSARIFAIAPALARLGVMRVLGRFQPASGLPVLQNDQLLASFAATKDWDAQSAEYRASPVTNAQVRAHKALDDLPLIVVSATEHGTSPALEQQWQAWQKELATLSTNSIHRVIKRSNHTSLVFDESEAKASVTAIQQAIEAARTGVALQ